MIATFSYVVIATTLPHSLAHALLELKQNTKHHNFNHSLLTHFAQNTLCSTPALPTSSPLPFKTPNPQTPIRGRLGERRTENKNVQTEIARGAGRDPGPQHRNQKIVDANAIYQIWC